MEAILALLAVGLLLLALRRQAGSDDAGGGDQPEQPPDSRDFLDRPLPESETVKQYRAMLEGLIYQKTGQRVRLTCKDVTPPQSLLDWIRSRLGSGAPPSTIAGAAACAQEYLMVLAKLGQPDLDGPPDPPGSGPKTKPKGQPKFCGKVVGRFPSGLRWDFHIGKTRWDDLRQEWMHQGDITSGPAQFHWFAESELEGQPCQPATPAPTPKTGPKFRVGDRVRVAAGRALGGEEFTVKDLNWHSGMREYEYLLQNGLPRSGVSPWVRESALTLVSPSNTNPPPGVGQPKFKVGDRVQVLKKRLQPIEVIAGSQYIPGYSAADNHYVYRTEEDPMVWWRESSLGLWRSRGPGGV